jgi:hypothetical protein
LYADDLDWEKDATRKGYRQDYTISFNGGNENADYYGSLGYIGEKGYTVNSDFKRWNARVNSNVRITSRIKAGVNVYGSTTTTNQTPAYAGGYIINPFLFFTVNGSYLPGAFT